MFSNMVHSFLCVSGCQILGDAVVTMLYGLGPAVARYVAPFLSCMAGLWTLDGPEFQAPAWGFATHQAVSYGSVFDASPLGQALLSHLQPRASAPVSSPSVSHDPTAGSADPRRSVLGQVAGPLLLRPWPLVAAAWTALARLVPSRLVAHHRSALLVVAAAHARAVLRLQVRRALPIGDSCPRESAFADIWVGDVVCVRVCV